MPKGLTATTKQNLAKILFIIKKAPGIHLRGICRALDNMNPYTVSTLIDRYLSEFVNVETNHYGHKLKTFTLKKDKENATLEDVLRVYQVRKSIREGNV